MRKGKELSCLRTPVIVSVLLGIFLLPALASLVWAQTAAEFSGQWQQDNDRCQPKHSGEVVLRIEQNGAGLTVETSISRGSQNSRHAVQRYTTDGRVSVSTGADGDEFHTSVVWKDSALIFSIEEHEEGRILRSQEVWSVIDNGTTLQRIREHPDGEKQVLIFRRQQ